MSKESHNVAYAHLREQFSGRQISEFTDEDLTGFVDILCDEGIRSDEAQTRALLRITAINHIQMSRLIQRLNFQNGITAAAVKRLTWFALGLAALQVFFAGFFVWREFHPRDLPVEKTPVSHKVKQTN